MLLTDRCDFYCPLGYARFGGGGVCPNLKRELVFLGKMSVVKARFADLLMGGCWVRPKCLRDWHPQWHLAAALIPLRSATSKAYMWHSVGKGPIWSVPETKILRKIDEMVKKFKKRFSFFWLVRPLETPYVGRIPKKWLQCSIYAQFYMAIKGPFGQFLLQLCAMSVKRRKNKFPTLRRCDILVKASPDRCFRKQAWTRSDQRLQRGCL